MVGSARPLGCLLVAAALVGGCGKDPPPAVVMVGDAGPRRPEDPLDCRTHLAHADTGEVEAKAAPFARVGLDGGVIALREGDAETWRTSLDAGAPAKSAAVLPRHVIVHDGERATALDRRTGKALWTRAERGTSVLALPGELVLVADDTHVAALAAKKGDEVFRAKLVAPPTRAPYLADERLVVVPSAGHVTIFDPPLAKGTIAPSTSRAASLPRYDVPADSVLGIVTTRGALGDVFVVGRTQIARVRSAPNDGVPTWSAPVPFADADALVVLDAEDTLVLAGYPAADGSRAPIRLHVVDVHGDELATRFDAEVPRAGKGTKTCVVALGRPAKDLVVAERCADGSAVTIVEGGKGAIVRRADFPNAP